MRTLRHLFGSALTVAALCGLAPAAQAQTPYAFPGGAAYSEDFATLNTWVGIANGTASVVYSSAPVTVPPTRFQRAGSTVTPVNTIVTANPNSLTPTNAFSTTASSSTGTQNIGTSKLVFLASGTGNAAATDLFLDFTGRNAGLLTFDWASVANGAFTAPSTNNRFGTLQVYASVNGTTWVQVGSDIVAQNNALDPAINNPAGAAGSFSASLPSIFNNSATARVRFYVHSVATAANNPATPATGGSRPKISVDNIGVTATTGGSPTFSPAAGPVVTPTTTTASPSTGVSVSFGGSNLTSDVTATVTGPFQLSTTLNGTYGSSATIDQNLLGSLFVRLNPAAAGTVNGTISYSGGGVVPAITATTAVTGTALAVQPTTQPTLTVTSTTATSATLNLAGGDGAKTLVIVRSGSPYQDQSGFQSSNLPVDGQAYAPSLVFGSGGTVGTAGVFTVVSGTATSFTVTGLTGGTQYSFVAFAYNDDNTAAAQNYLASGIPVASSPGTLAGNVVTLTTDLAPGTQYTWSGPANGLWSLDTNWTPTRTTPAATDFLEIPAGSSILYDVAGNQTIGNLTITGGGIATITLSGATTRTLTVAFAPAGTDFLIPAGATLRLRTGATSGTALTLTIGAGSTGIIAGTLDMDGTSLAVTSPALLTSTGTVTVQSGGLVTVGAFATGPSLSGAGLTFQNGSTLTKNGGTSPTANFQPTSTFNWNVNGALSFSGRTYGNLNLLDFQNNANQTGGGLLTINNLTFSATAKTVGLNLTGGIVINGNINVTAGTLNFLPATPGSLTLSSATATVTSVSPITFSNLTLNKATGADLELEDVVIGTVALTLGTGTDLNISKKLTFTTAAGITTGGNTLTLLSDATRTAYVVANPTTATGTATATVQRAIDGVLGVAGDGYRHYSSPVTLAPLTDLATVTSPIVFNTAYNSSPTPLLVVPYPNIFKYDPTLVDANTVAGFVKGYQSPAAADDMVVGKGYSFRKDRSTVDLTGTLNTGAENLTLVGDGTLGTKFGFNLLGNPYPSALNWSSTVLPAGVSLVAFVNVPTGPSSGTYVQYDHSAGATNKELPMAQGFFARKTNNAASASIALTNAMRVTTGDGNPMQRAITPVGSVPSLRLTIGAPGAMYRPEASVYFESPFTDGLDDGDGIAPGRSYGDMPTIATIVNGEEASVNRLSAFTNTHDVVVPMLIATPIAGQYSIDVRTLADFPAGTQVLLEDAVTGRTQDLTQQLSYSFTATANYAGQRFTLRFTAGRVTGVAADLTASALSVFPNPTSGTVRVSAPAGATVRVIDMLGRTVRTVRIDAAGTETTVGLDGLKAGLYTVRAGGASQKLVIQ